MDAGYSHVFPFQSFFFVGRMGTLDIVKRAGRKQWETPPEQSNPATGWKDQLGKPAFIIHRRSYIGQTWAKNPGEKSPGEGQELVQQNKAQIWVSTYHSGMKLLFFQLDLQALAIDHVLILNQFRNIFLLVFLGAEAKPHSRTSSTRLAQALGQGKPICITQWNKSRGANTHLRWMRETHTKTDPTPPAKNQIPKARRTT